MKTSIYFEYGRFATIAVLALFLANCQKVDVSTLPDQKSIVDGAGTPDGGGGSNPPGDDGSNPPDGGGNPPGGGGSNPPVVMNTSTILKPMPSKIDLLLVIDDSGSMRPDSLTLASKLEGFVQKLEAFSLDWQLCLTSTNINKYGGSSLVWSGTSSPVLKKGATNISQKVINTIDAMTFGENGSGDERGIAAMSLHLDQRNSNGCYRPGAALSTIVISDEDERSVGGIEALNPNQYRPLEPIDLPENYVSKVQSVLGSSMSQVALTSHSIITIPGDTACYEAQNAQGNPSYYGTYYKKLTQLTGGSMASICASDYSASLNVFATQIQRSLQRVRLDCVPKADYKITTSPVTNLSSSIDGQYLVIESLITQDILVNIQYTCQ